jgi:hypothetical protein
MPLINQCLKSRSKFGIRDERPDHISESVETIFGLKIRKFFDADPGSGMEKFGSGINIPDPQHGNQCMNNLKKFPERTVPSCES